MTRIFSRLLLCLLFTNAVSALEQPDFTLKNFDGTNLKLSEYRGQVVLVNFWASWCGPCRQEMPKLEELHQRYESLGVTILGVNVEEDSTLARRIVADRELTFPILADDRNIASELFDVDAMPSTVLIDKDGMVRFRHRGYMPGYEKHYEDQIRSLIRE